MYASIINPEAVKMKSNLIDVLSNGFVWLGAITAWQENFEWGLKVVAGILAIAVSLVTIYFKFKTNGRDK